jgi:hypothetical protein
MLINLTFISGDQEKHLKTLFQQVRQRQAQADLQTWDSPSTTSPNPQGPSYSIADFRYPQKRFGEDTHANLCYIAVFLAEEFYSRRG